MSSLVKVWIQLEGYEPEKVTISVDADVDDLKEKILQSIQEPKRNFSVFFGQIKLSSAAAIPPNTSYDEPILLKRGPTPDRTMSLAAPLPDRAISDEPSYELMIVDANSERQLMCSSEEETVFDYEEQEKEVVHFERAAWENIVYEHQRNAVIDLPKFLESQTSIFVHSVRFQRLAFDPNQLLTPFVLFCGKFIPDPYDPLDVSFNSIIDEPLDGCILVNLINQNQGLKVFIVDSLKRYNALTDIHSVLSKCIEFTNEFRTRELAQSFLECVEYITTRTLLVIALESLSLESQRLLGNFMCKNDLPLPLSYYTPNQEGIASYKINFNSLMEVLCLTTDRLYIQAGSKSCVALGKTSLLPYIFTGKRRDLLSSDTTDSALRNSCIDVLFGSVASSPYVIFDVHGTVDNQRNLSLVRTIQLYASVQVLYVTTDDLEKKDSFMELMMSTVSDLPTIVCIFDDKFDIEIPSTRQHQERLINRFQDYFCENQWATNTQWTTVPLCSTAKDLNEYRRNRRAKRLIPNFEGLFKELEPSISKRPLFRSIFAIQSTYLINYVDRSQGISVRNAKFHVEDKLKELFENLSDRTENLKIVSPISYYRSQIGLMRKKLGEVIGCSEETRILDVSLKQLEEERKKQTESNVYASFMINLLTCSPYIELVITDYYLEKWRTMYVPKLKKEKENLKIQASECDQKLTNVEEQLTSNGKYDKNSSAMHAVEKQLREQLREQLKKMKEQITGIDTKLANVDLTIGLMTDELFALYDFLRDERPAELDQCMASFEKVAEKLAQLVHKGFAIHVLRNRPLLYDSGLLGMCLERLRVVDGGLLTALTVVGEQSSAKSSLLNATFGCNFRVSAGRCTLGMYLGVAYHKKMTILIIDTEGLLSLEESGSIFDNQMITMAVLSSHLVLINHKGELSSSLEGLIGMSLYAKLQIQTSPFKPKLMFVLRDQTDRNKDIFVGQLNKFKDNLQKSSSFLRVSIDDELEISHDNIALLPSAFSEDINKDLSLSQRWRNQTFPLEIKALRATIFTALFEQVTKQSLGYKNIHYFYKKMSTNWKSIDELGQGLLECKNLLELSITNELKSIAREIMLQKSKKLLTDGRSMLKRIIINATKYRRENHDIRMKQVIEHSKQQLENLTGALIQEANNEFDSFTEQKFFAATRENIKKNIEPSVRCNQYLLQQQFEEEFYGAARESAENQIQEQLLNSARQFFERETRTNTDTKELDRALDEKYRELREEFRRSLESMRKTNEEIVATILENYNQLVKSRRANADKSDIYNRCPHFSATDYQKNLDKLDILGANIIAYRSLKEKDPSFWRKLFSTGSTSKQILCNRIDWFSDYRDTELNKEILRHVLETLIPLVDRDVTNMLHSTTLAYSDPQTVMNLIDILHNSMHGQQSPMQQNYRCINLAQITGDLIFIALNLLINKAIQISKEKDDEKSQALTKLKDWMTKIKKQFNVIRDSHNQGQMFMNDLIEQINEETIEIFKKIITDEISLKITQNSHIDPHMIARNAYDHTIGSNPPNGDSIMKYVLDINRYYLELAFANVKLSAENIVESQIRKLETTISDCVSKAIDVVKNHECHNVQEVYQAIIQALQSCAPGFKANNLVGISATIKEPIQFRKSFLNIVQRRQSMIEKIQDHKPSFDEEAKRACRALITQRLGCQACCPGCGAKCDNTDINHKMHKSTHHITMAFKGWRWMRNNQPTLELCYQNWLTGSLQIGEEEFFPRRKYYVERVPEWFDDLEEKSKIGDSFNENVPPPDQRRAWMAVRLALISHYGIVDQPSYDSQLYPNTIQTLPADYVLKWD